MTGKAFWVVWCPSHGPPTVRHETQCQARNEAYRLANKHQGHAFFVLRAEAMAIRTTVAWTELEDDNDIPF